MLYSNFSTDDQTLRAHFQPQTLEIVQKSSEIAVEFTLGSADAVRISNYASNDDGCVKLYYLPPESTELFIKFLKG